MSKENFTMEPEYSQKYLQISRGRTVVFDTEEVPFFTVSSDLSDLSENPSVAKDFNQRYPRIVFDRACVVDGVVLIQDLDPANQNTDTIDEKARNLNDLSKITLQVVNGRKLSEDLLRLLSEEKIPLDQTLIIFPGNGARVVSDYLQNIAPELNFKNAIYLSTERKMTKPGSFRLSVDYSSLPQGTKAKTAVIIDDVVASGQTVQKIIGDLRFRIPDIRNYIVAAWVFLDPSNPENKDSASGILGVSKTFTSLILKGNYVARPPINSLSCLIRSEQRYEEMKNVYVTKYIRSADKFQKALEEIKRLFK